MITVTPRASTMIRPTPTKSPAPRTIVSVRPFSPRPPISPTTIDIAMNRAASSGKYQSSCHPKLSALGPLITCAQGTIAKIMNAKVKRRRR